MGATAGVGITAVGNAYMQSEQGKASRSASRFNSWVGRMQADDALARGEFEETQYRRKVADVRGTQRSGYAAQNVDVDTGIAATVDQETQRVGELDALMIRNNAAKEAMGYRMGSILESGRGAAAGRLSNAAAGLTLATAGSDSYATYRKMNPK